MKTRPELDTALDALALRLPGMAAEYADDAYFWPEFAGAADDIVDNAGPADHEHVHRRLDAMLKACGKDAA